MPQRPVIVRHALLAVAFVAAVLVLNRPEVIVISRLGLVTWYPSIGLYIAIMLAISPWYVFVVCLADAIAGVVIYHQPIATFSGTFGSIGVAICYGAAAFVLRDRLRIDLRLRKRIDVLRYLAVTSAAAVSATLIGVVCLAADKSISWSQYWSSVPQWFLGDEIGLLAVAPFLLIYVFPWIRLRVLDISDSGAGKERTGESVSPGWLALEAAAQAVSLVAVIWVMFGPKYGPLQLFYVSYLPIIWIAMRNGIRRVVIGLLGLNIAIVVALHYSPLSALLLSKVVLLMFVVSATGLIVGSSVSERHRISAELQEQSTYLNSLIQNSPLGIIVLDDKGRIELTNDAFGKLFLYDRAELVGKSLHDIFPGTPETDELERPELFLGRKAAQNTVRRLRKDGQRLVLELNTVPVFADEHISGAFTLYKDISAQVRAAELEHQQAESLRHFVKELEKRTDEMSLLNEMGNLLECCATVEEAGVIAVQCLKKLHRDAISGSLYMFRSSRNLLETSAVWGSPGSSEPFFSPDACWGLRRSQPHWSGNLAGGITCSHLAKSHSSHSLCVPMVAQGETLGILQLQFVESEDSRSTDDEESFRNPRQMLATTVASQIALSLANLRLRETLRDQSIRDPLTGLFNRRFMEESLIRELDRARRRNLPLSLLFVDIDHFKRFNDTFGHDAGDYVLHALADLLRISFRSDDVLCRYGGEEFAFILPESSAEDSARRANDIRLKVKDLQLKYQDKMLGSVTLSIGVATFPDHGSGLEELLKIADQCLYQSKADGRDRVTVAGSQRSTAAAHG